jgi:hypothetical protein
MREIPINRAQYQEFRKLQTKTRGDCHAAFSTNLAENPWAFETFGLTPEELRKELEKRSPLLLEVVGLFVEERRRVETGPAGGRFFIDADGCYWKDKSKTRHRFVKWHTKETLQNSPQPLTIQGLQELMRYPNSSS